MKKLVIISDTHEKEKKLILPEGDILIHAGDFNIFNISHVYRLNKWFNSLDFKHIIFVGGNHDNTFASLSNPQDYFDKAIYLENTSVEIEGIKIWGSPYSTFYKENGVFMGFLDDIKKIWSTIPEDTDIVITHCPPFGINDQKSPSNLSQGCPALRDRLKEIKPKYHICGHMHEGYGIYCDENTTYINASLMNEFQNLVNKPIEIEYE